MFESFFALIGLAGEPATKFPPLEILEIHAAPRMIAEYSEPLVGASAAIATDLDSGRILFAQNIDAELPIASLTKLMTAIVVRENYDLDDVVVVSRNAAEQPPAKIWLTTGEKMTVGNLLRGMLIESGNDAATALGESIGTEEFVAKMNEKAAELGLRKTHFANPVGFDDAANYSTAREIALIAQYFLRDALLREIVGTHKMTIFNELGGAHHLVSTNILFNGYLDIRGMKTGSTDEAGECVAAVAANASGKNILALVLDSPNRFQEAKGILDWATKNWRW
jgi:D-alanyl-D-alanine carboxypeptidase (penicillin-binding protein 5/6)